MWLDLGQQVKRASPITYNTANTPITSDQEMLVPIRLFLAKKKHHNEKVRLHDIEHTEWEPFWVRVRVVGGDTPMLLEHSLLTCKGHDAKTGQSFGWYSPMTSKQLMVSKFGTTPTLYSVYMTREDLADELKKSDFSPLLKGVEIKLGKLHRPQVSMSQHIACVARGTDSEESDPRSDKEDTPDTEESDESQLSMEDQGNTEPPKFDEVSDSYLEERHCHFGHVDPSRLKLIILEQHSLCVSKRQCIKICERCKHCNYVRRSYPRPWHKAPQEKGDEYGVSIYQSMSIDLLYLYK